MTATEYQHQHQHQHQHQQDTSEPAAQQLQLFNRMQAIPLIELALSKSVTTYARIKNSHQLVGWALSTAESSLSEASRQAAPYAKRFEAPISYVDQKLCQGLDIVEERVPIVKLPPELIFEDAYMATANRVLMPAIKTVSDVSDFLQSRASSVKAMGWAKANEILDSYHGSKVVGNLNDTASLIDALIDNYFPPTKPEDGVPDALVPLEEDKLMHTLQTIGRLPRKAVRRVYNRIVRRLPFLSLDSFGLYMNKLLEFLRLAQCVSECSTSPTKNGKPKLGVDNDVIPF